MSAEYAAERIMDALTIVGEFELDHDEPTEDVLSGGQFFEFTLRGKTYEVLVTQYRGGER